MSQLDDMDDRNTAFEKWFVENSAWWDPLRLAFETGTTGKLSHYWRDTDRHGHRHCGERDDDGGIDTLNIRATLRAFDRGLLDFAAIDVGNDDAIAGDNEQKAYGRHRGEAFSARPESYLIVSSGGGRDTVTGGERDDIIATNGGNDLVRAGGGNDFVKAGSGHDTVFGGAGDDYIAGDYSDGRQHRNVGGNDLLFGDAGNDIILGNAGRDTLHGGTGNDSLYGGNGRDLLFGDEGNDLLSGGNGRDTLFGGLGDDTLLGGAGNDVLWGDGGSDTIDGGSGIDTARYAGSSGDYGLFFDADGAFRVLELATGDIDRIVNVEQIAFDDETFDLRRVHAWTVGDGAETFRGRRGSGTDAVNLVLDADALPSSDIEIVATATGIEIRSGDLVTPLTFIGIEDMFVTLAGGIDGVNLTISGDFDGVLSPNTTRIFGTTGKDTINTNSAANQSFEVWAWSDDDLVTGGAGRDTLLGGSGSDTIHGGDGDDILGGGQVGGSQFITDHPEDGDTDWVYGGRGNDILNGGGGKNFLFGGAGSDTIYGGNGNDVIQGSDGPGVLPERNVIYGGNGQDDIHVSTTDTVSGGDGDDWLVLTINKLYSVGAIVKGDDGNDFFEAPAFGSASDNSTVEVHGGSGRDIYFFGVRGTTFLVKDFSYDDDFFTPRDLESSLTLHNFSLNLLSDGTTRVDYVDYKDGSQFVRSLYLDGDFSDANVVSASALHRNQQIAAFALNRAPTANADTITTNEDVAGLDLTAQLLANDSDPDKADTTLEIVSADANSAFGAAIAVSNGQLTYDATVSQTLQSLQVGATFTDTFTYTVSDGRGGEDTATATVIVEGRNDAPVLFFSPVLALQGAGVGATALDNQSKDPEGDRLAYEIVSGNDSGLVRIDASLGDVTLARIAGNSDVGIHTLGIRVTEYGPTVSTYQTNAAFEITNVNDAPVARNDILVTDDNHSLQGNLLDDNGNGPDFDPDPGDQLSVRLLSAAPSELVVNSDGSFVFTLSPSGNSYDYLQTGEQATVSVIYELSDQHGATSSAEATIVIHGVNDAPVAGDFFRSIGENGFVVVSPNDPGNFDPDLADRGNLTFIAVDTTTFATKGSIALGSYESRYDPGSAFDHLAVGEIAIDRYGFTLADPYGAIDTGTVTVTIIGENDAPVAADDTATVFANQATMIFALANDQDVDLSDTHTITALALPTSFMGLASISADGQSIIYDPSGAFDPLDPGETAIESFSYTVSDNHGATATADVTVTVTGVNDAPVAQDDLIVNTVAESDILQFDFLGQVLFNDYDPDRNQTPDFSWVVEIDGTAFGAPLYGFPITLASGALMTVDALGIVTFDTNGAFEFLSLGDTEPVSIDYVISDGSATDGATITVRITGENDAPVAVDDRFATDEDSAFINSLFGANGGAADSDPDRNDTFAVTALNGLPSAVGRLVTLASGATLTVAGDGTFAYDPTGSAVFGALDSGDAPMIDTFTYEITDNNGLTDTATVTIEIAGRNDAPVAVDDTGATDQLTVLSVGAAAGLLANDSDPDTADAGSLFVQSINGQPLLAPVGQMPSTTLTLVTGALITVFADGSYAFDPNGVYNGLPPGGSATETVAYTVSDGDDSAVGQLSILIVGTDVNVDPVAVDDAVSTNENIAISGNVLADNGNGADSDSDGDPLTVISVDGSTAHVGNLISIASGANVRVAADGTFSYDQNLQFDHLAAGETANDSFTYTISDGNGGTDSATVTVTIVGENDAPIALADAFTLDEDSLFGGNLLNDNGSGPDGDIDGDPLAVVALNGSRSSVGREIALESGALLTLDGDGTFQFNPNGAFDHLASGETATEAFSYTIADRSGLDLVFGTASGAAEVATADGQNNETTGDGSRAHLSSILAFDAAFVDGVNVAGGDLNGDGVADIIAGAAGGSSGLKVFDGVTNEIIRDFSVFEQGFANGISVAAGDLNGDGIDDIIAGAGAGGDGRVRVIDGSSPETLADGEPADVLWDFLAFGPGYTGSLQVASGDVTGDGVADVVVGAGEGSAVRVFDGATRTLLLQFDAFEPSFTDGVRVAVGDINGDGRDDIVTGSGPGGGSRVRVFDGADLGSGNSLLMPEFQPFEPDFANGVNVATGDLDGDGHAEILVGAGAGSVPEVKVFGAASDGGPAMELESFLAFDAAYQSGVTLASGLLDGRTDTATVTLTIVGKDEQGGGGEPPVAGNIAVSAFEDGPAVTFAFPVFDGDAGDTFTFDLVSTPFDGITTNNGDGTFTFDPAGAYESLDQFQFTRDGIDFTATDSQGNVSNVGVISVTIVGQDEASPGDTSLVQIAGIPGVPETYLPTGGAQTTEVEVFEFDPSLDLIDARAFGVDNSTVVNGMVETAEETLRGLELTAPGTDPDLPADDVVLVFVGLDSSELTPDWFVV